MNRALCGAVLIVAMLLGSGKASAQNPKIAFTLVQDVSFGTVPTNTSINITVFRPGAGEIASRFKTNSKKAGIASFNFALPRNLTSEGNTLPIIFGANSAAYNSANCLSGSTCFDPSQGLAGIPVAPNTRTTIYFWIGATISPDVEQAAGIYRGEITVVGTVDVGEGKTATATQTIDIRVTIIPTLSLAAAGSLDFGQIVAGTHPPSLSAQYDPNVPMFTAAGAPGKEISVSYHSTVTLSDCHGHTLTFTPSVYGSSSQVNQTGSTPVPSGTELELSRGETGNYYFWLGGMLKSVPRTKKSGSYKGTFTLTVSY
ncbi:MAG: DUF4402 domain-containing protein [Bacteroidetes bacterium]|nr:DUF4402 domain-containing protein [Bacteroidota bacterium]